MSSGSSFGAAAIASFAVAAILSTASLLSAQEASPADLALANPSTVPASNDPRAGLEPGVEAPGVASWNMRLVSNTPKPEAFEGVENSDLAFFGDYVVQGNYNGFMIWDVSDPAEPVLRTEYFCPGYQNDVSVYGTLLFVSNEGYNGRIDCGPEGVPEKVSDERLRGIRIFDISDLDAPVNVANVQTCTGSHTHSLLFDPSHDDRVYVYVSGSGGRSPEELGRCSWGPPDENPETALFRIEVIEVLLDRPEEAAVVSTPRILDDLAYNWDSSKPEQFDYEYYVAKAKAEGGFIMMMDGRERTFNARTVAHFLEQVMEERGSEGDPTPADSAALRERLTTVFGGRPKTGPTQCHDITLYPEVGLAAGACYGYGLLIDIRDPVHPERVAAAADSNFSYWHSATFNNDGTKVLFGDEWGGGGAKCRESDPMVWGADAIFTVDGNDLTLRSYYKMPAVQTPDEHCVAHNGSLVPIPGRDVMVQGWYQGGISVFDWTDPTEPVEIAFFDRGPMDPGKMNHAGSWSAYWYNGLVVSSEVGRGLDVLELVPSEHLTGNEIEAAKTARLDYLNVQGQQRYEWPATFALAGAYLDQLERGEGMPADRIATARGSLEKAQELSGDARREALGELTEELGRTTSDAADPAKIRTLAEVVSELANADG